MNRKVVMCACLGLAGVVAAAGGFGPLWQPEKKTTAPAVQPTKPDAKAPAQPEAAPPAGQPEDPAMAEIMPGAAHKQLAKLVGEWETATTFSVAGNAMPATKGTAKVAAMLGDRFFKEESSGELMGQAYSSFKTIGYNNGTKKYEGAWLYTMSTAMMTLTGTSTDDGKTITFTATVAESAEKTETMSVVLKWTDDNSYTVTLTSKGEAPAPDASMETKYTRKK